jgi:tetratricopeptide (TPR) repeat protein
MSHHGRAPRWLLILGLCIAGCAHKAPVPVPVVTAPKFPEFMQPGVPPALANTPAANLQSRGWAFLQAGDLKAAEREFTTALKAAPAFYPAEASLGYVDLARKDPKAALPRFDRALQQRPNDAALLVGRGQTLVALNRESEALIAFEAAVAADPSLTDLSRRVEVMKFRGVEQNLARARQAARSGQFDEAIQIYTTAIANSPDSPFLYREIAAVERKTGNVDAALEHFRRAAALDPTDAASLVQIGEILEARGELEDAEKAYAASVALEPNPDVDKRLAALRARVAVLRLPAEYRAIDTAPEVTRADLAALIGVRLAPLLEGGGRRADAALITDVRSHWAATWILAVARAGVMDPFANHAFQPRTLVRRIDLAQAVARLLPRAVPRDAAQLKTWQAARLKFSDLTASHLAYPAASAAVASGVLSVGPDNAFQPSRPVSGAEAIDAISRIEALAGLK